MHYYYSHEEANRAIAALSPGLLALVSEGDRDARELVLASAEEILALAGRVATKLFPAGSLGSVNAGVSGPILTHPAVLAALALHSSLALTPVEGTPIEGIRQILARDGELAG